jgi:hypothetical protein
MLVHVKVSTAQQLLMEAAPSLQFGEIVAMAVSAHNSRLRLLALLRECAEMTTRPSSFLRGGREACIAATKAVSLAQLTLKVILEHRHGWLSTLFP